ncbi:MAG TPA: nickel/cobalt transporter [Xanthobacteraceae bacterium]|nr:nickel/cobalt transporter [Xanthobacteraceae bacterium]
MRKLTGNIRYPIVSLICLAIAAATIASIAGADAAWAQASPFGGPRPVAISGFAGWILAKQAVFYRALAGMLHAARDNGSALWGLMGISFLYGIFHAAGPGHGKAVISSYLFANEETWRRGITLSFISAAMQSLTAITVVGIAAVLLGATAKFMSDTVHLVEIVSYGLIVLLGLRLLWVKGHSFARALRAKRADAQGEFHAACSHAAGASFPQAHCASTAQGFVRSNCETVAEAGSDGIARYHCQGGHDHWHDEEQDVLPWGHAHGPEAEELAGAGGWRRGLSAVVAVGLRPCSGAIIILVFALAQGMFWAGIASTLVMGLGTAITVGAIATLAVGAKAVAKRVAQRPSGYGTILMRGAEFAAAGCVLTFGILLLTGYMASERMGLF